MTGVALVVAEVVPDRFRRQLRRYRRGTDNDCPLGGYHNAIVDIGEVTERAEAIGDNFPHDDPRWPTHCACGYEFVVCGCGQPTGCRFEDYWQRNDCRIVRLPDGTEFTWWGAFGKVAPPGTMIRAEWFDEFSQHPERIESWLVSLPDGGEWITSQSATGGGYWTVTGTPPGISAHPSIWHNSPTGWHGFIRNGHLEPA